MLARAVQQQETVDGFTWAYRVSDGEATIMKLEKGHESCAVSPAPKGHFTIPSTLGGAKVTGIGGYAFSFCGEMTSVTLPDAVKEIGWSAFLASGLTSVKIPEGVMSIGNQAFYGCGKLTSVTIPASVESVGWGVFGWCPQLKQINLADGNQRFTVVDGVLYTKDLSELIMCPNTLTSVKIPSKVSKIGMMSFEGCEGVVSLKIPEGVTDIGSSAFRGCRKLASVTIPASVESIGEGAFGGCRISVDPNNQKFTLVDGVLYTKDRTELVMCPISLTSVTILPDVKVVRPSSFSGCGGLTSITIPESVTNIGHSAFWGCNGLKSVTIPSRVANIGQQAFNDCLELTTVTMLGERPASLNNIFDRCGKLKAIHVPAKCKSWAGVKKWQKLPLVFDGVPIEREEEAKCQQKTSEVKTKNGKGGVKERTFGADDGLPCELTVVELPGDGKVVAFAIGKYEITQEQYEKIMGANPSTVKGEKLPVNNVTYDEAKKFCERLNSLVKHQGLKWALPDEKQWHYAARGGEKFKFPGSDDINEVAWTMKNSGGKIQPVGGKKPNGFGLHDMCGNVCEWGHFSNSNVGMLLGGSGVRGDTGKEYKLLSCLHPVGLSDGFRVVAVTTSIAKSKQTTETNVVAEKLQRCKFLVNGRVKQRAKIYLCLFSASWCGPRRAEMPRIAKTYAETLKDDPDIELIHFSCDRDDSKAMAWAKEHDVKFPVVKPKGGNPLDLHARGIPHLFIVKADGTLLEEGHPMRLFNEAKFRELKQ